MYALRTYFLVQVAYLELFSASYKCSRALLLRKNGGRETMLENDKPWNIGKVIR